MNIFAAIKKAINSNLNKPLDITLDEIKDKINRSKHVVSVALGTTYNSIDTSQVLSADDNSVFSIEGAGRIFQVIPVYVGSASSSIKGTALISIDDDIVINNHVRFATKTMDNYGYTLIDNLYGRTKTSISISLLGEEQTIYTYGTGLRMGEALSFNTSNVGIIAPQGVPFVNNFKIRLTQSASESLAEKIGVIVVYELYE